MGRGEWDDPNFERKPSWGAAPQNCSNDCPESLRFYRGETQAQRGKAMCPRSHSKVMVGLSRLPRTLWAGVRSLCWVRVDQGCTRLPAHLFSSP